jgi:hypothetical protein
MIRTYRIIERGAKKLLAGREIYYQIDNGKVMLAKSAAESLTG